MSKPQGHRGVIYILLRHFLFDLTANTLKAETPLSPHHFSLASWSQDFGFTFLKKMSVWRSTKIRRRNNNWEIIWQARRGNLMRSSVPQPFRQAALWLGRHGVGNIPATFQTYHVSWSGFENICTLSADKQQRFWLLPVTSLRRTQRLLLPWLRVSCVNALCLRASESSKRTRLHRTQGYTPIFGWRGAF